MRTELECTFSWSIPSASKYFCSSSNSWASQGFCLFRKPLGICFPRHSSAFAGIHANLKNCNAFWQVEPQLNCTLPTAHLTSMARFFGPIVPTISSKGRCSKQPVPLPAPWICFHPCLLMAFQNKRGLSFSHFSRGCRTLITLVASSQTIFNYILSETERTTAWPGGSLLKFLPFPPVQTRLPRHPAQAPSELVSSHKHTTKIYTQCQI